MNSVPRQVALSIALLTLWHNANAASCDPSSVLSGHITTILYSYDETSLTYDYQLEVAEAPNLRVALPAGLPDAEREMLSLAMLAKATHAPVNLQCGNTRGSVSLIEVDPPGAGH